MGDALRERRKGEEAGFSTPLKSRQDATKTIKEKAWRQQGARALSFGFRDALGYLRATRAVHSGVFVLHAGYGDKVR